MRSLAAIVFGAATACAGEPRPQPAAAPTPATNQATTATSVEQPAPAPSPFPTVLPDPSTPELAAQRDFVSKRGRPVPLNATAVPFAHYLNAIHNRIHPEFSDGDLGRLEKLPKTDPLNDQTLSVGVMIIIDGESGAIDAIETLKPSKLPAFDDLAREALKRSAPFAKAADEIRSADGKVYVYWEFARNEVFACSTMHSRPWLLAK